VPKLPAAAVELGPDGLAGRTPRSAPVNVTMAAEAGTTVNDRRTTPAHNCLSGGNEGLEVFENFGSAIKTRTYNILVNSPASSH